MRRTLFGFTRDPPARGRAAPWRGSRRRNCAASPATLSARGWPQPGPAVEAAAAAVLDHLGTDGALDWRRCAPNYRPRHPDHLRRGGGRGGAGRTPAPTLLGARGDLFRGRNGGHRGSRPRGRRPVPGWARIRCHCRGAGVRRTVRRGVDLRSGTERDLTGRLGRPCRRSAGARRRGAIAVALDSGETGWSCRRRGTRAAGRSVAALSPGLDPTTMGWKQRGFDLDPADAPLVRLGGQRAAPPGGTGGWSGAGSRAPTPASGSSSGRVRLRGPGCAGRGGRTPHRLPGRRGGVLGLRLPADAGEGLP